MKYNYTKIFALGLGLSLTAPAFSQTGPGGVSAVGTSTNLQLWLQAERAVFTGTGTTLATNGQSVTQWNDASGNGKSAYNASGTTRPVYSTTGGANGYPTLEFNPASLQTITAGVDIRPAVMPDVTVMAVARVNNTTAAYAKIWGHDNPGPGTGFHRGIGKDPRIVNSTLSYFAGTGVTGYGNVSAGSYFISTANYTASTFTGFLNGLQAATGAVACNGGLTAISIGSLTPTSEFWDGAICEFIIFNKTLSEAERVLAENYLAAKYGISIGSDVYNMDNSVSGDFDFEVAGIGAGTTGAAVTSGQGSGIVRVSAPSGMTAGEYFMFGHNNLALSMTGPNRPAGFNSRLTRTWRASEIGDVGTMAVSLDVNGVAGIPGSVLDYAMVIDRDNDGLFSDETLGGGGVIMASSLINGVATFNNVNISDGQRFTFAFTNTVALPLELVSFEADATGTQNKIRWEIARPKGIAGMELERSGDGKSFGLLHHQALTDATEYAATDAVPAAISYYRLRIVEQDGSSSFSNIIKVLRQDHSGALQISPNPTRDLVRIDGLPGTPATIRVVDAAGRQLRSERSSETGLGISLAAYPAGTYVISIDADGMHAVKQVVKF